MSNALAKTNQDLDQNMILGYLAFYTLGEIKISEQELEGLFQKNNLPTRFIKKISKADAFRRASSSANGTIEINFAGNTTTKMKAKVEVDELRTDQTGIVRLMGRKVVDAANEELSYETVGRIEFDKSTRNMFVSVDPNKPNLLDEYDYQGVLDSINRTYQEWAVYHTKDTIKNLTVNITKQLFPVNLMPSGVAKFIPKSQKDYLFGLQGLIRDLSSFGAGNLFEIIPVIDTDEQRELIERTASNDMREEMNAFVGELKEVITNKHIIPVGTAKTYVQKFNEMKNKIKEYEGLVGVYMQVLHAQLKTALEFVETHSEEETSAIK